MPELIPHIQQYAGVWSIEPNAETQFRQLVNSIDWTTHAKDFQSRADEGEHKPGPGYEVTDSGVAVVDLEGVLTKYGSSLSMGGSTIRFQQTLRQVQRAYESGTVKAAMLVIESPGGATMGTPEAAAEVAKLASVMPVWTFFDDIGASAAYWIGSQATHVVANASALVGSIGTYFAVDDVSAAFTKNGVKTHLFTTGEHKGAGYLGTELTEAQQAEMQSLVERMNAPFVAAVQEARGLDDDQLANVTDGRVWRGDEAVAVGLIDAVMSYEDALAQLASTISQTPVGARIMTKPRANSAAGPTAPVSEEPKKDDELTEEEKAKAKAEEEKKKDEEAKAKAKAEEDEKDDEDEDAPASIAKLKAALPKASAEFMLSALEAGVSVHQARTTWLEQTVALQAVEIETLKSAKAVAPGAKPLGNGNKTPAITGDAKALWEAAIKSKTDTGMSRARATSAVVKEQPELQSAYIEAMNTRAA